MFVNFRFFCPQYFRLAEGGGALQVQNYPGVIGIPPGFSSGIRFTKPTSNAPLKLVAYNYGGP